MQRWDNIVMTTHWCVALGFLVNRFHLTQPGDALHRLIGIVIVVLIILRLVWGMTGAKGPARLSAIIPTFSAIRIHLHEVGQRRAHQVLGHNPIGSLAIWAFWFLLPLVVLTGWGQSIDWMGKWPLDEWHEILVNIVTVLVALHITAVVSLSIWLKHNLVTAMLPGSKYHK